MNLSQQIDSQFEDRHANVSKVHILDLIKQTTGGASTCIDCMHAELLPDDGGGSSFYVSCQRPGSIYGTGPHNVLQLCDSHTEK